MELEDEEDEDEEDDEDEGVGVAVDCLHFCWGAHFIAFALLIRALLKRFKCLPKARLPEGAKRP